MTVGFLLFQDFEPLDVFGPLEAFVACNRPGEEARFQPLMIAQTRDPIAMVGGTRVIPDHDLADCPSLDLLLVPGGIGTRREYANPALLQFLRKRVEVLASVCTGAALLGAAGLLSGLEATTNRRAFDWVVSVCPADVRWNRQARWVDAGRIVTSAGVSAGTDMALHLVARWLGQDAARAAAERMEYRWDFSSL